MNLALSLMATVSAAMHNRLAALAARPWTSARTGILHDRMASYMLNAEKTSPPGELTRKVMLDAP